MATTLPDLQHATISQLQIGLSQGLFTSLDLVKAYIARIEEVNPVLSAVISVSPAAFQVARQLDKERKEGRIRSIIHGVPIALKETIAPRPEDGMDTTAGSFALQGAVVPGDAEVVARLREAGAVILCKANLSTFGHFRGVADGAWSPIGGQCISPFFPRGHPSGSSSGCAVAVAAGLVSLSIGGETGGSIIDTFGPMCKTVEEAAAVLEIMTDRPGVYTSGFTSRLDGFRLLAPTNLTKWTDSTTYDQRDSLFAAFQTLRGLGAVVVEAELGEDFLKLDTDVNAKACVMETVFAREINEYLASLTHIPSGVRTLKDLIQYIKDDPRESPLHYDTCRVFESALARPGEDSIEYREAKAKMDKAKDLIDEELQTHSAQAYVMLSGSCDMWSHAAFPQVTVPLGFRAETTPVVHATLKNKRQVTMDFPLKLLVAHPNQPYGITFAGRGLSEDVLIQLAYAFEQATQVRARGKTYLEATPTIQLHDMMK